MSYFVSFPMLEEQEITNFSTCSIMTVKKATNLANLINNVTSVFLTPRGSTDYFDNVMTKYMINNSTDA